MFNAPSSCPVQRIVLTGGPCGGKTTCLSHLSERLESLGWKTYLVPEVATLLFLGGAHLTGMTMEQLLHFESRLLSLQISLEDHFTDLASVCGKPSVVLCDRGTMDVFAYLPPATKQILLDEGNWQEVTLRDQRYDAVIHLVTAADGAEAFYTKANNPARQESPEEARALDRRMKAAWVGHPHLRVIDNTTPFDGKIRRTLEAICNLLGVPSPREIERKFLLKRHPSKDELPVEYKTFEIEQTYLQSENGWEARLRRRSSGGASIYTHTMKQPSQGAERVEIERQISAREYIGLLAQADPERQTIHKQRTCFLWQNVYFEMDLLFEPFEGMAFLEIELDREDQEIPLPPFVAIDREVTGEPAFSNASLAKKAVPSAEKESPPL